MAKHYHKNPRIGTSEFLNQLEENIKELGDLSGITLDLNSDEIITGNQRSKVINLNECEKVITEEYKKPDNQGTVAIGYVIWNGIKLNYREVKWTEEQREKANITANSIQALWDESMLKGTEWNGVSGLENWNLPFVLELPPLLENNISGIAKTSNKYHDVKPLIFISFNLVQRQINVPEEEAKEFLSGIIEFTRQGGDKLQEFYDDIYRLSFDHMQEVLSNSKK